MIVLVCLESQSPSQASRAALRLACGLGEKADVVVVSAGGAADSGTFQLARQSAAVRRIIHLDEPTFDKADFFTLGVVLAETARHLGAHVVLMGERSDGEGQGMVPAALAHHLGAPLFARVAEVQLPENGDRVLRLTVRSSGRLCRVESPLPAVLATPPARVTDGPHTEPGINAPAVEILTLSHLAVDASRLVPRPGLLGTSVSNPAVLVRNESFDEAARSLLRRQ